MIGAKYATGKEPIKLYFTPTPGHYETLQDKHSCMYPFKIYLAHTKLTKTSDATKLETAVEHLHREVCFNKTDGSKISPILFCNTYFMLEQEGKQKSLTLLCFYAYLFFFLRWNSTKAL